ncbi:transmembrane protein 214 isoform X1 [Spea bombifrons]|uniref:transmembrane protein 214 isoform X1 n=1 Tax=Spea bombifrons TaxID=233779 RepID=UPI00234B22BA|nr:transmembrane protein 214 isoform X1 [Spea bombifrons]
MASGATDGKWKVVKKGKKSGEKSGGGERRALGESNAAPGAPVKTTSSLYEMGFDKMLKKQNKEQVPPSSSADPPPQRKQPGGKGGKKTQTADSSYTPRKFGTLEEALKALDIGALQRELEKSQRMFHDSPSIWLKDLAGYLNDKLQAPREDPTLSQHPHDYPYCLVSKELRSVIRALVGRASGCLEDFIDHCVLLMLLELDRPSGESLYGYQICIQAVLTDKPKVVTGNLKKHLDLLSTYKNRPAKGLTVMWLVSQAGFVDLTEGLKVWLGVMLPVLGMKTLSPYAVSYLERLLLMHSNLTKGFGMIGPKDFFPLLDFAFMPHNSLSASQQGQLRDLYPRLKVLAFGASPESTLHSYFPSFLSRATANCPADMKKELMLSLTECLNLDPLSFSVWRQLYTKYLPQSSLLLQHLVGAWDAASRPMRKSLRETVHSFKVTNEEFSAKGQNVKDVESCDAACGALLQKMKGRGPPWFRFFLVALVFVAGFVIHDIRTHGTFEASSSARMLEQSGLLDVSREAWSKASDYTERGHSWLQANVPLYYSQAVEVMGPSLELLWAKSKEGAEVVGRKCTAFINFTIDNLPWFIEWLQARTPDFVYHLIEFLRELLLYVHRNVLLPAAEYSGAAAQRAWQQYVDSCKGEVSWDCTKGHVGNVTQSVWTYLHNTTLAIKNWALAVISGH